MDRRAVDVSRVETLFVAVVTLRPRSAGAVENSLGEAGEEVAKAVTPGGPFRFPQAYPRPIRTGEPDKLGTPSAARRDLSAGFPTASLRGPSVHLFCTSSLYHRSAGTARNSKYILQFNCNLPVGPAARSQWDWARGKGPAEI